MARLSDQLGVEIYFKRDDLTGSELSGNKIRKLEFLLAEAKAQGAGTVITCGGAQSNHCRATALAATRLGFKSVLLLRTADPLRPPTVQGNILLDRLAGAEIIWITPDQYRDRDALMLQVSGKLQAQGDNVYIIPEGGSNAMGAWGYVRSLQELQAQLDALNNGGERPTTVVTATGSGGTTSGLLLGRRILTLDLRVVGVNVCDDREYFQQRIGAICSEFKQRFGLPDKIDATNGIEILDGYVGRGYALSRPEELAAIRNLARLEGVILDPVYTGKAYFGLRSELQRNPAAFGERIIFIHTGGIFGLFPIAADLAALVEQ
jgi:D-cysteine desulfhydrase